jgi:hypothetical protein
VISKLDSFYFSFPSFWLFLVDYLSSDPEIILKLRPFCYAFPAYRLLRKPNYFPKQRYIFSFRNVSFVVISFSEELFTSVNEMNLEKYFSKSFTSFTSFGVT